MFFFCLQNQEISGFYWLFLLASLGFFRCSVSSLPPGVRCRNLLNPSSSFIVAQVATGVKWRKPKGGPQVLGIKNLLVKTYWLKTLLVLVYFSFNQPGFFLGTLFLTHCDVCHFTL